MDEKKTASIEAVRSGKTDSIEAVRRVPVTRRTPQKGHTPAVDQARRPISQPRLTASPEGEAFGEPATPLASPFGGKSPKGGMGAPGLNNDRSRKDNSHGALPLLGEVPEGGWGLHGGTGAMPQKTAPTQTQPQPSLSRPGNPSAPETPQSAAPPESDTRQAPSPAPQLLPDLRGHFARLCAEGEALHRADPDFDLAAALRDPDFLRLTAPGVGVPAADAWYALHRREYTETLRRTSLEQAAAAVAAGRLRPREGGRSSGGELLGTDARHMSPAQRADLRERIKRGEKVYPR